MWRILNVMDGGFGLQTLADFDGMRNSLEKAFILSYSMVAIKKNDINHCQYARKFSTCIYINA